MARYHKAEVSVPVPMSALRKLAGQTAIYGFSSIVALCLTLCSCSSSVRFTDKPTPYSIQTRSHNSRGIVFTADSALWVPGLDGARFTPTAQEITKAERLIRSTIKQINASRPNQVGSCPRIDKNLRRYHRQYIGYLNDNGERNLLIGFTWNRFPVLDLLDGTALEQRERWTREYYTVFDGCSLHWSISVNLTTDSLFNFGVNGLAQNVYQRRKDPQAMCEVK